MKRRFTFVLFTAALCAPLASSAQAPFSLDPTISESNLVRIAPHVWEIKAFPNIGIVVGTRGTLVVDTGMGTKSGADVARIARKLSPPGSKLYLTTTHFHAEHASGDAGFPAGTPVIRPRVQQEELEADGERIMDFFRRMPQMRALLEGVQIRKADVLFDDNYHLDLGGGVRVALYWFGAAHTRGDEIVMVEPDGVMLPGDVVQNHLSPSIFGCDRCSPRSWLEVLDRVAALKPRFIVPDHGDTGDGSLVAQERAFLANLEARIMALKAEGKSADEAAKIIGSEFQTRYPDWRGLGNLDSAVNHAYSNEK